ncbi:oligopeptidase F [Herbinix hemicellulosilytica]|uniref:Oligopeptidase F n=1 Tax=Herbinix hemicellulosilytica TaxID=1564487 RepID=A0A0H5STX7_HERHM|nr:oligoendopeptidase F [Herbinix hemicellulosilytica]RBP60049.1 oligopeptidase F [Herbinix hemicellulosilytica]CRZ33773.1 Oligoendopeptidase F homolog [Herbinix hemicellulosilytica]
MAQSNTLPKRSEVEKQYTWAIEDLFATDELWEEEYNQIKELLPKAESYKGKLAESAKNLLEFLKLSEELGILMDRVYVYANQKYHEDTANSVYQDLADKAGLLLVQYESALSFATPEILTISEETLQKYMQEEEGLRLYDFYLKNILRRKPHILSAEMEALLADAGDMASGPDNIYSKFNNADLKFPEIKDEDGNLVRITHGRYIRLMESNDRRVRQDAFKAVYETYGNFKNTLAATFSSNIKQELFFTKARKYGSNLEKALDETNVPVSVYTNLIEAVHDNLDLMHRYISLRKKILGLDELHMYDIYAPLIKEIHMDIPFEEAKKIVAEGLKPLGEDYQKVLQEGFNNRWIDVYENENKRSGAYSWGAYGTHPYVLLNYNGSLDNVFTLAHEMGHAIHSYYSDKTQPFIYAGYKIFVAEVASTCNEALLINHMLKTTDDKMMKAYLINHFLDTFRGTLYRQTMFAEFEMITHKMVQEGQSLTAETLCKIYHELNEKYYGKDIVIDPEIDMEWARIPHFYEAFYVYQYATGFSAAIAISRRILQEGKPAVDDYIRFLSSGGSNYPIELLKIAGVDMSTKDPVNQALKLFGELLDQLEELMLN